jgi:hypothetical protein
MSDIQLDRHQPDPWGHLLGLIKTTHNGQLTESFSIPYGAMRHFDEIIMISMEQARAIFSCATEAGAAGLAKARLGSSSLPSLHELKNAAFSFPFGSLRSTCDPAVGCVAEA